MDDQVDEHADRLDEGELVSTEEAAELLGVEPDRVGVLRRDGLLTATESAEGPRYRTAEVLALRLQGG